MSFLMVQSKKQMTGISQKTSEKKNPSTQRENFRKVLLNKFIYDVNTSNVMSGYKGSKKLSSKYNTLKNSRKLNNIFYT